MFNDIELSVLEHDPLSNGERLIGEQTAHVLAASGYYRESTGAPYGATHYRRPLRDGSCLHLVMEHDRVRLHHDAFDPHAGPFSLWMHLTHEARADTVTNCTLAWCMVKLLTR